MYRKNVEIEMLKIVKLEKHHGTLHICRYIYIYKHNTISLIKANRGKVSRKTTSQNHVYVYIHTY